MGNAVAIIGMAGRFPGADDVCAFWRNIRVGVSSITQFSPEELEDAFSDEVRNSANFVRARAILRDVDQFDAEFFGMRPREAALTDPQHRLLLECAWSALEDGGYDPSRYSGAIGVFAGCSMNTYLLTSVLADRAAAESFASDFQVGSYDTLMGALSDTLATRLAYKLNLRGPAMTVQSACSTSLLAVAQACQSLLLYQSDMALAGGVSITFPQKRGYLHQEGGMVSADGVCRSFDADATGTIFADGGAMVLLKRLEDAIEDGDHIYAVVRGCAVNNDGSDKVGFTAPSVQGQAAVIASAHAAADVDPRTIGYVECHGTATPLGDPIEFAGLVKAFGQQHVERPFCALGSAKANVGHMDVAAGIGGLIKAALALHHREIPPLANFRTPNPHLNLSGSPFYIPNQPLTWQRGKAPRRAGVSALGVGGTNVHVVLEEAPHSAPAVARARVFHVLPLSARSEAALARLSENLASALESNPSLALADVAHTLQTGRRRFAVRRTVVCHGDGADAVAQLRQSGGVLQTAGDAPIVFMFPGQGAQHAGMGKSIYEDDAGFRADIDRGAALLEPLIGLDLRQTMFAPDSDESLKSTLLAQTSLFLLEYALARLWMRWGVKPDAMIGHSLGEFTAASIAGVFTFEDGLSLVAARARLMQALPPGAMLAMRLPEDEARTLMGETLDLAAINAPSLCVASGPDEAIAALERELAARRVGCRRLNTSHAFHTRAMDPVVDQIEEIVRGISLSPASIPYASCLTGAWSDAAQQTSPHYWASHCRAPVRFAQALETVVGDRQPVLLEVGPGRTQSMLAAQAANKHTVRAIVASLPGAQESADPRRQLALAAGELWKHGAPLDWSALDPGARRTPLPTYPFERRRHWIDPPARATATASATLPASNDESAIAMPALSSDAPGAGKRAQAQAAVIDLLASLSGDSLDAVDPDATFLELGFDSLFLGQVAQALDTKFGLSITFRQLLGDTPSIAAVAALVEAKLPDAPPFPSEVAPSFATTPGTAAAPPNDMQALFAMQTQAMQQLFAEQLRALRASGAALGHAQPAPIPAAAPSASIGSPAEGEAPSRFSVYRPAAATTSAQSLSEKQERFIDDLVRRVNAATPRAKALTQENRAVLADPRSAAGFRAQWKELVYPIVCARSKGARIWDIDGNEYIDLVNGYGQTAFGHAPDFVAEAVAAQLAEGFAIGPQSPLAGEVAKLIAEMTGAERVTFCNTGSEAVMAAMRVARTVTGRARIATFANDYHGQFDEVLIKAGRAGAPPKALPASPGVPPDSIANMVVLPYGEDESLTWIAGNAAELAAVVVEPVQSRHPELRPVEFLRQLRAITANAGVALVFDEVVTGFRVHPGGMQALWDIKADLTTYGKVLGGGMPIGVLAGVKRFMDALDGGHWRYGDDSMPETAPTFFAGTFVRHPLALAAAKAVLVHLKQQGPVLQEALGARTQELVARINADFARRGLAQRAHGFSSWFYVTLGAQDWLGSLFYPLLRLKGVNIQEGSPCFLTTAHSQADIDAIAAAFSEALDELHTAGILLPSAPDVPHPAAAPALPPAPPREAPVTEPQMEIWLAAQLGPEASCAFNRSLTLALSGTLDVAHLAGALNEVVSRHDALRSRFLADGERFEVAPILTLALEPLEAGSEVEAEALLADFLAREARTPFDLIRGPLIRVALVRHAPERHVLVLGTHHIVCDGWSFNIILAELAACYRARKSGVPHGLSAPMSYAQFAFDSRARRSDGSATERFWLDQFADIPALPELPTDRPRPAQRSYGGDTYTTRFDAAFVKALRGLGARHDATLFTTLLAGLQALVGRLSNHTDIVIAGPVAGQSLLGDGPLVGHCANLLPRRAPFDWSTRFGDHLASLQHRLLDAFEHQNYTYGTLLRRLQPPRTPNRLPLTEIQFNLERISTQIDFSGAVGVNTPSGAAYTNFDLFLNCAEDGNGLRIDCDYNTEIFDHATVARWIGHYRTLLAGAIGDASRDIAHLPLLSKDEQTWLLDTLNDTALARPPSQRVEALIAAQAAARGEAVACIDAACATTYAQLEARANRLAREIARAAPGGGGRVAVALERSRDLIAALLAVLKAGHAYVPLDPDLPAARLRQILEEADVAVYLCDDAVGAAAAPAGARILRLDRISLDEGDASPPPAPDARDDAPAYVIFTSGSTGKPKGVEISHRALANFLSSITERPGFTDRDTIVAATTISFDIAALELLAPLLAGGRVVIASRDAVRDGYALVKLIDEHKATVVQATPSLWKLLLEAGFAPRADLRMLCGGENLPRDLADRLLAGGPLWNLYGPTETTIWSSAARVAAEGPIVIGAPIANTQMYVLDERDQLAPIGAIGTLHIGGMGLANGYFRQPELTQRAFRTLSIAGRPGQRLYNTGDLARRLPSGDIQVLGRADHQVKLRGFRIELEEIEITLRKAPGVQACAVALRDVGAEPALAAYYVAPRDLNAAELAAFVRERLPDYMTPSHWMRLERLPLSPSGKLDRRALPTPIVERASAQPRAVEAARTPLEAQIAEVWEDVLGRNSISVNDPIFALGADSLQIFRIAARLNKQGIAVGARELMKNPTVAMVAKTLDGIPVEMPQTPARSGPSLADFRHGARRQVTPS